MMKRSIVTTDVAVCLTTFTDPYALGSYDSLARIFAHARCGICACIHLESICNIAPANRLPQIQYRKQRGFLKLDGVSKLVQEQFG